ncbi:MAG TPA: lytic murein transglycosylase, partial [Solirubrobacteraceae bacterium]|nr:lytic murein transglycosylase [Solirubrobacteraceae bacterium]
KRRRRAPGTGGQSPAPTASSQSRPTKATPVANASPFSFAFPAPASTIPDFFISSFQIPPFLLPIYQAAGIEYDVPWPVLAAINEVETDYGRNLSISSAGAVGWMQFLPSTWERYGVDATGSGYADPYNPVDAIFAAARYLHAAGASTSLQNAVYAYNHASWYVRSVLLRAELIGGIPEGLVDALSQLVEARFPVAAPSSYLDAGATGLDSPPARGANPSIAVDSNPTATTTTIFAKPGAPVIAVSDGTIVGLGHSRALGRYIELRDATGNLYTYADLGSVATMYPVPKSLVPKPAALGELPGWAVDAGGPSVPASAGIQTTSASFVPAGLWWSPEVLVKERLFADPWRPASYAAGGNLQIQSEPVTPTRFDSYFSGILHLPRDQYTLSPLRVGAIVVGGTILGRVGLSRNRGRAGLAFRIRPAGPGAPYIDPKPILDGWRLLQATAVYRAPGADPFLGRDPSVGQLLLMSKEQLEARVLADPQVQLDGCERRQVTAGLVDRRILGVLEFLSASGIGPTATGAGCGGVSVRSSGATASDPSIAITALNHQPVLGHQGAGSLSDLAIRRLLTLQGTFTPAEIISLMSYRGQSNTLARADHANRIEISFPPATSRGLGGQLGSILQPGDWTQLISRLDQIPEPVVPVAPSRYAIRELATSTSR